MGIPVLLIGRSGTGKSASLRNFTPEELEIINVESKPLPFRNKFKPINTDNYYNVCEAIKGCTKKSIVVDDAGYLITNQFMRNHSTNGAGNQIFAFYNSLADQFWKLITFIKGSNVPPDRVVYVIMHEDRDDFGFIRPKTIGKLLDEKVTIEGMFTIAIRSIIKDEKYLFLTKTDGMDIVKTPMGMFEQSEIENDLKAVDSIIREYYEI